MNNKLEIICERFIDVPEFVIDNLSNELPYSPLYLTKICVSSKVNIHYSSNYFFFSQYTFIYCSEGKLLFEFINSKTQTCILEANQYIFIPKLTRFTFSTIENNPGSFYWINFDGKMSPYFINTTLEPVSVYNYIDSNIFNRDKIFEEMYHILESGYSIENLINSGISLQRYLLTLKYIESSNTYIYKNNSAETDLVYASIHFMKENINRRLTLKQLANFTGKSVTHYCILFKNETGTSPVNYFNDLKIKYACELFKITRLNVRQISFKVGFDDPFYFSKLFSKFNGVSPVKYKQIHTL